MTGVEIGRAAAHAAKSDGAARPVTAARSSPRAVPAEAESMLQRCACGGSCPRCRGRALQSKLAIDTPADAFEREAAGDAVMSSSPATIAPSLAPPALRRCACGGSCPSCRKGEQKEEGLRRADGGGG